MAFSSSRNPEATFHNRPFLDTAKETEMTPSDTTKDLDRCTDEMTAEAERPTQGKWEEVFLYGYVYFESDEVLRLYQGLGISQYYCIPKKDVLSVTSPNCPLNPSMIKLRLPATCRITYVSSRSVSLPAGSLAAVVATQNEVRKGVVPVDCPAYCKCNGKCTCADIDHWLNLSEESARKLGVFDPARS
jgi:hypothetical protein